MTESPEPQHQEELRPRYGVVDMSPDDLSSLIARLEAEWSRQEAAGEPTDTEPFNLLNHEIADVLKRDPAKGRELCVAMARSPESANRRLIAHNMPDLAQADRVVRAPSNEDAATLFAELLTDDNPDVKEAAYLELFDGADDGRMTARDCASVASELTMHVVVLEQHLEKARRTTEQRGNE